MAFLTKCSFKVKIASRGYHVFKETTWNNIKEGDSVRVDLETSNLSKAWILTHVRSVRKINFLTRGRQWDIS